MRHDSLPRPLGSLSTGA